MYVIKTYLKSQGHLKAKVKATEYQCKMKGNQFSVYCKCFCDLCATWMVRLRLKSILVPSSVHFSNLQQKLMCCLGRMNYICLIGGSSFHLIPMSCWRQLTPLHWSNNWYRYNRCWHVCVGEDMLSLFGPKIIHVYFTQKKMIMRWLYGDHPGTQCIYPRYIWLGNRMIGSRSSVPLSTGHSNEVICQAHGTVDIWCFRWTPLAYLLGAKFDKITICVMISFFFQQLNFLKIISGKNTYEVNSVKSINP